MGCGASVSSPPPSGVSAAPGFSSSVGPGPVVPSPPIGGPSQMKVACPSCSRGFMFQAPAGSPPGSQVQVQCPRCATTIKVDLPMAQSGGEQQMQLSCPSCSKQVQFKAKAGQGQVQLQCPGCATTIKADTGPAVAPRGQQEPKKGARGKMRVACPNCRQLCEFMSTGQPEVTLNCGGCQTQFTANVEHVEVGEEERGLMQDGLVETLPAYWSTSRSNDRTAFEQMFYVSFSRHGMFTDMLAKTYKAKATQDRPCPKDPGVKCPKTRGGCPCVQPGGIPGLPVSYHVRRVIRIEDSDMWSRYMDFKRKVKSKRGEDVGEFDPPPVTEETAASCPLTCSQLDRSINETYLWHGTHVRVALAIANTDFRIDLAGSSVGTMYGRGCYLAENSTKADEYAKDEPGGYYEGVYALLLCRAVMGKFFYTSERDEQAGKRVESGEYDSVLGDRVKTVGTFREFVVFDADQVYPEYIVIYTRVHSGDPPEVREKPQLHMELPVYWANCAQNPTADSFQNQYIVRDSTKSILENLAQKCMVSSDKRIEIVCARRIENSQVWSGYLDCKARFHGFVRQQASEHPHEGLAGFRRAGDLGDSEGVLTWKILRETQVDGEETVVSIDNIEALVNEELLWHGTSQHSAEVIARSDFRIASGKDVKAGQRFGAGAYFAEDMSKSLTYAPMSESNTQYVLLCRVLCGDMYYTERSQETDADDAARASGKHSVLANPEGKGPREFVMFSEGQVYAEYILEIIAH